MKPKRKIPGDHFDWNDWRQQDERKRRSGAAPGSEDRLAAWLQHELCRTFHIALGADGPIKTAKVRWAKWVKESVHDNRKRSEVIAYRHLAGVLTRKGFKLPNDPSSASAPAARPERNERKQ